MTQETATTTRRFWLSFVDNESRPHKKLGVAIVEVDDDDIHAAKEDLVRRFPHALPDAELISAAVQKAWDMGCNPGGTVLSEELPPTFPAAPLHRLMDAHELRRLGLM